MHFPNSYVKKKIIDKKYILVLNLIYLKLFVLQVAETNYDTDGFKEDQRDANEEIDVSALTEHSRKSKFHEFWLLLFQNNSVGSSIEVITFDESISPKDLSLFNKIKSNTFFKQLKVLTYVIFNKFYAFNILVTQKESTTDKEVQTTLTSISAEWNDRKMF